MKDSKPLQYTLELLKSINISLYLEILNVYQYIIIPYQRGDVSVCQRVAAKLQRVPKSKLLVGMYYQTHEFWTWVQNQYISHFFKFWFQGKNMFISLHLFINFSVSFHSLNNNWKIWNMPFPFMQIITNFDFWNDWKSKIST